MNRRSALKLLAALPALASYPAYAQTYPQRPVRVVVPLSPGGSSDIIARTLFAEVSKKLGQQFYIDNRPGAGGTNGASEVARAAPDGETLLFYSANIAFAPALYKNLSFSPSDDLTAVAAVARAPYVLVVSKDSPYNTLQEFIDGAKKSSEGLFFASAGIGSGGHLGVEQFKKVTDTKFTHVPYGGAGPAVVDLVGGQVDFMIESAGTVTSQIQSGGLKALAVTSTSRLASMPDVPTMKEAGVEGFVYYAWYGVWGPHGLQPEVVATLNESISKALADPAVQKSLASFTVEPWITSSAEFSAFVDDEIKRWGLLIKGLGIEIQ